MYVCICNAVRESDLERAAHAGHSFEQFRNQTGCAGTCGTCMDDAETLFRAAVSAQRASKRTPFSLPIVFA
jgi:bacterioferritin-associated ferredoxin